MKVRITKYEKYDSPDLWSFESLDENNEWKWVEGSFCSDQDELAAKLKYFKDNGFLKKETSWEQEI
jgi:hypothetical protein